LPKKFKFLDYNDEFSRNLILKCQSSFWTLINYLANSVEGDFQVQKSSIYILHRLSNMLYWCSVCKMHTFINRGFSKILKLFLRFGSLYTSLATSGLDDLANCPQKSNKCFTRAKFAISMLDLKNKCTWNFLEHVFNHILVINDTNGDTDVPLISESITSPIVKIHRLFVITLNNYINFFLSSCLKPFWRYSKAASKVSKNID